MKTSTKSTQTITTFQRVESEIVNGIDIREIIELFSTLGYDCEIDCMITGTSGTKHHFDILARKGSEIIVMNIVAFRRSLLDTIASDEESNEQILVAAVQMRTMAWDCQAYHAVILHLNSSLSGEDAQRENEISPKEDGTLELTRVLRQMKIELVRSPDIDGVIPKLNKLLCAKEVVA